MAGRAVALLPCASGPSSWWRRIGYRWLTPSCCGVWSPAGGLFPGRPGVSPLGPVSRIIPLTEVSGIEQEIKGHMPDRPDPPAFRCLGTPPPVASTPVAPPFAPCLRAPPHSNPIRRAAFRRPGIASPDRVSGGRERAAKAARRPPKVHCGGGWGRAEAGLGGGRGELGRGVRTSGGSEAVGQGARGASGGGGGTPGGRREFGTPRAGRAGVSECYTGARFASVASRDPPGG